MRWRERNEREWHDWFAWRPVYVLGGDTVWLTWTRRRYVGCGQYQHVSQRQLRDYRLQKLASASGPHNPQEK